MSLTERLGVKACEYQKISAGLYQCARNGEDVAGAAATISEASRIFLFAFIDDLRDMSRSLLKF